MPYVLFVMLTAVQLLVPVLIYPDEDTCKQAIVAMSTGASGTNEEVKIGCEDLKTVKDIMDRQNKKPEEKSN